MAAVGGGGGGEDPNRHLRDFWKHWNAQPKLTWNPMKIGALPGGRKSVSVILVWHGNAQVLCGHMVRYGKTPFAIVGMGVISGLGAWFIANRDNEAQQRQIQQMEGELRRANDQLRQQLAEQQQINRHLQELNKSYLERFRDWLGK